MIAICVEDEPILIKNLVRVVESSAHIEKVFAFDDEFDALNFVQNNNFDIAFLDIRLHSMNGIELAERLSKKNPDAFFIFCTGYKEFAFDAIQLHLKIGYLLKPVTAEAVQLEIDKIIGQYKKDVFVKCFGNFEIFHDGKPLQFSRNKSKEVLAYLVDRCGAVMTAKEICSVIWENDSVNNMSYLRHLIADLRQTFRKNGIEDILLTSKNGYTVDISKFECDYHKFLNGDEEAVRSFFGEYMTNYSWAETTCAEINEIKMERQGNKL